MTKLKYLSKKLANTTVSKIVTEAVTTRANSSLTSEDALIATAKLELSIDACLDATSTHLLQHRENVTNNVSESNHVLHVEEDKVIPSVHDLTCSIADSVISFALNKCESVEKNDKEIIASSTPQPLEANFIIETSADQLVRSSSQDVLSHGDYAVDDFEETSPQRDTHNGNSVALLDPEPATAEDVETKRGAAPENPISELPVLEHSNTIDNDQNNSPKSPLESSPEVLLNNDTCNVTHNEELTTVSASTTVAPHGEPSVPVTDTNTDDVVHTGAGTSRPQIQSTTHSVVDHSIKQALSAHPHTSLSEDASAESPTVAAAAVERSPSSALTSPVEELVAATGMSLESVDNAIAVVTNDSLGLFTHNELPVAVPESSNSGDVVNATVDSVVPVETPPVTDTPEAPSVVVVAKEAPPAVALMMEAPSVAVTKEETTERASFVVQTAEAPHSVGTMEAPAAADRVEAAPEGETADVPSAVTTDERSAVVVSGETPPAVETAEGSSADVEISVTPPPVAADTTPIDDLFDAVDADLDSLGGDGDDDGDDDGGGDGGGYDFNFESEKTKTKGDAALSEKSNHSDMVPDNIATMSEVNDMVADVKENSTFAPPSLVDSHTEPSPVIISAVTKKDEIAPTIADVEEPTEAATTDETGRSPAADNTNGTVTTVGIAVASPPSLPLSTLVTTHHDTPGGITTSTEPPQSTSKPPKKHKKSTSKQQKRSKNADNKTLTEEGSLTDFLDDDHVFSGCNSMVLSDTAIDAAFTESKDEEEEETLKLIETVKRLSVRQNQAPRQSENTNTSHSVADVVGSFIASAVHSVQSNFVITPTPAATITAETIGSVSHAETADTLPVETAHQQETTTSPDALAEEPQSGFPVFVQPEVSHFLFTESHIRKSDPPPPNDHVLSLARADTAVNIVNESGCGAGGDTTVGIAVKQGSPSVFAFGLETPTEKSIVVDVTVTAVVTDMLEEESHVDSLPRDAISSTELVPVLPDVPVTGVVDGGDVNEDTTDSAQMPAGTPSESPEVVPIPHLPPQETGGDADPGEEDLDALMGTADNIDESALRVEEAALKTAHEKQELARLKSAAAAADVARTKAVKHTLVKPGKGTPVSDAHQAALDAMKAEEQTELADKAAALHCQCSKFFIHLVRGQFVRIIDHIEPANDKLYSQSTTHSQDMYQALLQCMRDNDISTADGLPLECGTDSGNPAEEAGSFPADSNHSQQGMNENAKQNLITVIDNQLTACNKRYKAVTRKCESAYKGVETSVNKLIGTYMVYCQTMHDSHLIEEVQPSQGLEHAQETARNLQSQGQVGDKTLPITRKVRPHSANYNSNRSSRQATNEPHAEFHAPKLLKHKTPRTLMNDGVVADPRIVHHEQKFSAYMKDFSTTAAGGAKRPRSANSHLSQSRHNVRGGGGGEHAVDGSSTSCRSYAHVLKQFTVDYIIKQIQEDYCRRVNIDGSGGDGGGGVGHRSNDMKTSGNMTSNGRASQTTLATYHHSEELSNHAQRAQHTQYQLTVYSHRVSKLLLKYDDTMKRYRESIDVVQSAAALFEKYLRRKIQYVENLSMQLQPPFLQSVILGQENDDDNDSVMSIYDKRQGEMKHSISSNQQQNYKHSANQKPISRQLSQQGPMKAQPKVTAAASTTAATTRTQSAPVIKKTNNKRALVQRNLEDSGEYDRDMDFHQPPVGTAGYGNGDINYEYGGYASDGFEQHEHDYNDCGDHVDEAAISLSNNKDHKASMKSITINPIEYHYGTISTTMAMTNGTAKLAHDSDDSKPSQKSPLSYFMDRLDRKRIGNQPIRQLMEKRIAKRALKQQRPFSASHLSGSASQNTFGLLSATQNTVNTQHSHKTDFSLGSTLLSGFASTVQSGRTFTNRDIRNKPVRKSIHEIRAALRRGVVHPVNTIDPIHEERQQCDNSGFFPHSPAQQSPTTHLDPSNEWPLYGAKSSPYALRPQTIDIYTDSSPSKSVKIKPVPHQQAANRKTKQKIQATIALTRSNTMKSSMIPSNTGLDTLATLEVETAPALGVTGGGLLLSPGNVHWDGDVGSPMPHDSRIEKFPRDGEPEAVADCDVAIMAVSDNHQYNVTFATEMVDDGNNSVDRDGVITGNGDADRLYGDERQTAAAAAAAALKGNQESQGLLQTPTKSNSSHHAYMYNTDNIVLHSARRKSVTENNTSNDGMTMHVSHHTQMVLREEYNIWVCNDIDSETLQQQIADATEAAMTDGDIDDESIVALAVAEAEAIPLPVYTSDFTCYYFKRMFTFFERSYSRSNMSSNSSGSDDIHMEVASNRRDLTQYINALQNLATSEISRKYNHSAQTQYHSVESDIDCLLVILLKAIYVDRMRKHTLAPQLPVETATRGNRKINPNNVILHSHLSGTSNSTTMALAHAQQQQQHNPLYAMLERLPESLHTIDNNLEKLLYLFLHVRGECISSCNDLVLIQLAGVLYVDYFTRFLKDHKLPHYTESGDEKSFSMKINNISSNDCAYSPMAATLKKPKTAAPLTTPDDLQLIKLKKTVRFLQRRMNKIDTFTEENVRKAKEINELRQ